MDLGTKIRNIDTDSIGVVVSDIANCCEHDEIPIEYEGDNYFTGTDVNKLESLGPLNPEAEFKGCGGGKREKCCKFLTAGPNGLDCERFSSLRNTLIFKNGMSAQRQPSEPYPECKNQSKEG